MKNRMLKAGTCVPAMKVADVTFNVNEIIKAMKENQDCGLLVFPELCITGYTCADLFQQTLLLDQAEAGLKKIANASQHLSGLTAVVSLPLRFENSLYNCAAYVSEGVIAGLIPKEFIPTYGEFYEGRWFTSGKNIIGRMVAIADQEVPFGIDILAEDEALGALIGTDICEDLWVPDKPSTHCCLAGANLIVNPSASDEIIGKQDYRRTLVSMQSASCYCAYLYVSSGPDESSTDLVFSGHSIIAESGRLLKDSIFEARSHTETAIIDLDQIMHDRIHESTFTAEDSSWFRHVQVSVKALAAKAEISTVQLSAALRKEHYVCARNPFVPKDDAERNRRCGKILEIQANGLATRVKATGIKTLIIGISGGLDSTLALIVASEAKKLVKDIRIIGYTMPNTGNTTGRTYENALKLMKALKIDEIREVPIGKDVQSHLKAIGHSADYQGEGDTAYENAQARMRTYILMDAANMENGLVVGTGDLSELALGWCTYNGDHMSMYGVNASVPKTLVQFICRTYAEGCGNKPLHDVLIDICDTPITPELTPSKNGSIAQKTEEKIGKYDLNDFFLFHTLRYGTEPAKVLALASAAYPEVALKDLQSSAIRFYNRFFHQQFKRSCLPDGPKVGSVTLSPRGDWRMPSDASVELWLSQLKSAVPSKQK